MPKAYLGPCLPGDLRSGETGRLQRSRCARRTRCRWAHPHPGRPGRGYDDGLAERTILVEFDSVDGAVAARENPAHHEALATLAGGVEGDFRIVEGVDRPRDSSATA